MSEYKFKPPFRCGHLCAIEDADGNLVSLADAVRLLNRPSSLEDLVPSAWILANVRALESHQQRWVSVKERLPENNQQVWVNCGESTTAFAIWTVKDGWFYGNPGSHDKAYSFDLMSQLRAKELGLEFMEPLHWMPLPSPPDAEGE